MATETVVVSHMTAERACKHYRHFL